MNIRSKGSLAHIVDVDPRFDRESILMRVYWDNKWRKDWTDETAYMKDYKSYKEYTHKLLQEVI